MSDNEKEEQKNPSETQVETNQNQELTQDTQNQEQQPEQNEIDNQQEQKDEIQIQELQEQKVDEILHEKQVEKVEEKAEETQEKKVEETQQEKVEEIQQEKVEEAQQEQQEEKVEEKQEEIVNGKQKEKQQEKQEEKVDEKLVKIQQEQEEQQEGKQEEIQEEKQEEKVDDNKQVQSLQSQENNDNNRDQQNIQQNNTNNLVQEQQNIVQQENIKTEQKEVTKKKKRIFDDIQPKTDKQQEIQKIDQNILRKQTPLTIDLTQYQTDLTQSVNIEQIQQFNQENLQKSQQYNQQQFGKHHTTHNSDQQQYRQQPNYEVDEHSLLVQAKLERKRENFKMLKDWDMQRAMFLNTHRGMLESIQANIDQLLIMSQQQSEVFIQFFTNKCQQEANYSQIPINQQTDLLKQNPLASNFELYKNFQNIIQNFEDKNLDSVKKAADFAKLIDIEILRELVIKDFDNHNQIIGQIRGALIKLREDITKLNQITQKKSQKLSLLYHSSTPKQGYPMMPAQKRVHKDLYKKQLGFLRKAINQQQIQKSIAINTIQFWVQAKNLEVKRANVFHEALKKYHNGFIQRYGFLSEDQEKEAAHIKLLEVIPDQQKIEDIYSIKNILSTKEIDQVKELFQYEADQELKFEDLQKYLEKFQIQDFNDRFLVMKEWTAGREIAPGVYKDTKIITTADNFIQCFDIVNQLDQQGKLINYKFKKPEISMYLSKPNIIPHGNGVVEIKINATNFVILKSKTTNFFKFKNDDSVEEFMQHISNL